MSHNIFGWSYPPGCHSVPGDEPWTKQLSNKQYHASIEYSCVLCSGAIKRGELYNYRFYLTEDGTAAERSHIECPDWNY